MQWIGYLNAPRPSGFAGFGETQSATGRAPCLPHFFKKIAKNRVFTMDFFSRKRYCLS
jgi:hypothetical protein